MPDKVRLLFLGDLIGRPGRQAMRRLLPGLISQYDPTVVMANGENAAGGVGLTEKVAQELFEYFDVITTGNHIWDKKEILPMLDKTNRILRPANYPPENPGQGTTVIPDKNGYPVAVLNLQGRVFMEPIDCPFRRADEEIARLREKTPIIIVDFHAEATSEKQAMGWYLDGRVSAVLGTHTHVPTADGRVLPQGTAFVTDVGMVGGRDSIIGVKREQALQRFLSGRPQRFEPAKGRLVLMAAYVEIDSLSGRALTIKTEVIEEKVKPPELMGQERKVLTVSQLTQLIKQELETLFPEVWVEGEISNFRPYHSGHVYFTLKDSQAQLKAVLFRSAAQRVAFELQDGLKVVCRGAITVYEPRGEYQIIVEEVLPRGKGALQLAFEQLRAKLEKEGLFAKELKKKLPLLPKKVGVVTSPHGAAIVDILRTLERRFARLHILIYPVRVQGEGAAAEIVEGIRFLSQIPDLDAIIVGRGGGSIEDLWAFNEESVARAIFACPIPIISAVGHEIDFTIADFVADVRASTPSAAAEMLIEKEQAFEERIGNLARRLSQRIQAILQKQRHDVFLRIQHRAFQNFRMRLLTLGQRVDELEGRARKQIVGIYQEIKAWQARVRLLKEKMSNSIRKKLAGLKSKWDKVATQLDGVSPLSVLRKGYALCWQKDGEKLIRQASDVLVKDEILVRFYRGELTCLVQQVDALKTIESMLSKETK